MKLSHSMLSVLFALVLLFAQQAAALHAMSHAFPAPATTQEQDLPAAKTCSQCLALAELQGALPPALPGLITLLPGFIPYSFASSALAVQPAFHYAARAPPASL